MSTQSRRSLLIGCTTLLVALALVIGAAGWRGAAIGLSLGSPIATGDTPIKLTVSGEELTIAADKLRFSDQRRAGSYERIELELTWPNFSPLQPDDPAATSTAKDGKLIFISIEHRDSDLDTGDRIGTIYQKFLTAETLPGPDGLIRRRFSPNSAYAGEELYFEGGSVHPFAARCYASEQGMPLSTCLRDVRLAKHLRATIRFPYSALAGWRSLALRTDDLLDNICATTDQ